MPLLSKDEVQMSCGGPPCISLLYTLVFLIPPYILNFLVKFYVFYATYSMPYIMVILVFLSPSLAYNLLEVKTMSPFCTYGSA